MPIDVCCRIAVLCMALALTCVGAGCLLGVLLYIRQRIVDRVRGLVLEKLHPETTAKTVQKPQGEKT